MLNMDTSIDYQSGDGVQATEEGMVTSREHNRVNSTIAECRSLLETVDNNKKADSMAEDVECKWHADNRERRVLEY